MHRTEPGACTNGQLPAALPLVELPDERKGKASECLVPHAQYRALGRTEAACREVYRLLFRIEIDLQTVD
jgi:hypothetical protein